MFAPPFEHIPIAVCITTVRGSPETVGGEPAGPSHLISKTVSEGGPAVLGVGVATDSGPPPIEPPDLYAVTYPRSQPCADEVVYGPLAQGRREVDGPSLGYTGPRGGVQAKSRTRRSSSKARGSRLGTSWGSLPAKVQKGDNNAKSIHHCMHNVFSS